MSFALAHESNKNKAARDGRNVDACKTSSYYHANTNSASRYNGSTIHLQRTIGNQAVHRLVRPSAGFDFANIAINSDNNKNNVRQDKPSICTRDGGCPRCSNEKMVENNRRGGDPIIQPKLKISQPNDPYEQEADRVADNVMRTQISSGTSSKIAAQNGQGINRKCMTCEKNMHENEKPSIRRKSSPHISSYQASDAATSKINAAQSSSGGGSSPLDVHTKEFMESRFGFDFSKVRIHSDKRSEVSARSVGALAYTKGNDVFFGKGQYESSTWQRKRLLAHELTHVIQQTNVSELGYGPNIRPDLNISNSKEVTIARKPAKPDIRIEEGELYVTVYVNDYPVVEVWNLEASEIRPGREQSEDGWDVLINIPDVRDVTASAEHDNIDLLTGQGVFVYVRMEENIAAPHLGGRPYMDEAERALALVEKIWKERGKSIDLSDEKVIALKHIVDRLPLDDLRQLEKEVVTWPTWKGQRKLNEIIEMITKKTRKSDVEESELGRFSEAEGSMIKQEMWDQQAAIKGCLNFISNKAIFMLFADEEEQHGTATNIKEEYEKGALERKQTTTHHAATLSRLASEARLKGLMGPVNLINWVGSTKTGRHDPPIGDIFDRFSGAGDGWYFFLVTLKSIHTLVIAVHVSSGGSNRKYFWLEAKGRFRQDPETGDRKRYPQEFTSNVDVSDELDDDLRKLHKAKAPGAGSRVWEVYFQPTD